MKTRVQQPRTARCALLAGLAGWPAAALLLCRITHDSWLAVRRPQAALDDALALTTGVLGLLVLAWLAAVTMLTVAGELLPAGTRAGAGARRISARAGPAGLRRLIVLAVGTALLLGTAPAHAAGRHPGRPATTAAAPGVPGSPVVPVVPVVDGPSTLDPSWRSTAPAQVPLPPAAGRPLTELDPGWGAADRHRPGVHPRQDVVVRRGDTLWDIAARHLGPAATDAEISRTWPQWYAANRHVIGSDPDRLQPGQQLRPPPSDLGGQS